MTSNAETQTVQDWLDYLQASINAMHNFKGQLLHMACNDNRELKPGEFQSAMRKLNDVIGDGYLDSAAQDLDKLAAVVTGEGLPQDARYANDDVRDTAKLEAIFGGNSLAVLEVRFMPANKVAWTDLTPVFLKVRKANLRDDVTAFYFEQIWAKGYAPCALEIRVNVPGAPSALAYWDIEKEVRA